jgi:hypothetical protein
MPDGRSDFPMDLGKIVIQLMTEQDPGEVHAGLPVGRAGYALRI